MKEVSSVPLKAAGPPLLLRSGTVRARLLADHQWSESTTWWYSTQVPPSPEQDNSDSWQANPRQHWVLERPHQTVEVCQIIW